MVAGAAVELGQVPAEAVKIPGSQLLGNPVDLARTVIVLQSDAAALMGYTGAVIQRFLGSPLGTLSACAGLVLWIVLPVVAARRSFDRRDF